MKSLENKCEHCGGTGNELAFSACEGFVACSECGGKKAIDKMEEEKMREAFEPWFMREYREKYQRDDFTDVLRRYSSGAMFGEYISEFVRASEKAYLAAIAHANTKHSKIIEDYDRLAKLCKKQAVEIEALQYRLQGEFDRGVDSARKEIQTVEVGENSPDSLEDWIGDKPVMRIQFYSDSGDMSVGIWPTSGWEVSADQSGTVLEELLSSLSAASATIAIQVEALKKAKTYLELVYVDKCPALVAVNDALSNTQAASDAFMAEERAKVLEDAATLCESLKVAKGNDIVVVANHQAKDDCAEMLRNKSATFRSTANRKDE